MEHVGLVLSGATAAYADGTVTEPRAGDLFYIPPTPHDSWVVGSEPYVSLHFLGADHYARGEPASKTAKPCDVAPAARGATAGP
ncbi:MAG TPA: hypothetical protein VF041_07150 [Gemmatimonadaceae bacterium]